MPEDENNIAAFDPEAFASDLAGQAGQVIPQDINRNEKEFILGIIYRFCKMAGEAIIKEENTTLNAGEASLVVQFIGEWIFHKSIDIIRAEIDPQYYEGILQKVAFTVYDIAKKAVEKQIPQDQLITLVEAQVKKAFEKALADLQKRGALPENAVNNALNQSNVDSMSQEQVVEELEEEIKNMSDEKIIKLASLAVLMKNFSSEKIKNVLQNFNKPERDVILKYLKTSDLDKKLDTKAILKCFDEMKSTLPEAIVVSYEKAYKKMYKIVKNSQKYEILNIIEKERPNVKEFVLSCYEGKRKKMPAYVADVISKYVEDKISW